jgi:GT2 family glycosyltransferase
MASNYPKVSIIVLNYNGKKYLDGCFQSLVDLDYPNYEVVMVDNKSTDDSVEYVQKKYNWVRIIQTGRNGGFAFGNNIGIKETRGEYIFLLNNDTISTRTFLRRIVEIAESDPDIGIVSPIPLHMMDKNCLDVLLDKVRRGEWKNVENISTVAGATMLIKRKVIEEIGLLDETAFLYWEDTEFCWRANLLGFKVVQVFEPDAIVYHLWLSTGLRNQSTGLRNREWQLFEFLKNKIYAHLKLMSIFYLALYLPYEAIMSSARIFYYGSGMYSSITKAWLWNIHNLRETIEKRRDVRSRKIVSDWKLIGLMIKHSNHLRTGHKLFKKCRKGISS